MDAATGQICVRSRFWISLRADGELSELESALLDAHLAGCKTCASFADSVGRTTDVLRREPLAGHPPIAGPTRVHTPRRAVIGALAAAVVVVGAVLGGALGGALHGSVGVGSQAATRAVARAVVEIAGVETADQLRELRRTDLMLPGRLPRDLSVDPT